MCAVSRSVYSEFDPSVNVSLCEVVCVRVCVCMCLHVSACVCACVYVCGCVLARISMRVLHAVFAAVRLRTAFVRQKYCP